jgi:hypothetical protein
MMTLAVWRPVPGAEQYLAGSDTDFCCLRLLRT